MGLTVSRKTVKNLAIMRKNCQKITVRCKIKLTVKKSNHESKSLKSLMRTFVSCCLGVFDAQDVLKHGFADVLTAPTVALYIKFFKNCLFNSE